MSNIIVDELDLELEELETEGTQEPVEQTTPDFDIPEKFKSADRDTVIKSYIELEKTLGHKAQELGELRKLADGYLKQELDRNTRKVEPEVEEKVDFDDLLSDTRGAINKAVDPKIKNLESRLAQYEQQIAQQKLNSKHPGYQDTVQSEEFQEWVKSSPYRVKQFMSAHQKMDLDAADELLSTWKERTQYLSAKQEEKKVQEKQKREGDLKKVALESGSTGESPKKIYRRLDLINLRISNPEKFDSMYEEIARAYQEGRVK